MRATSSAANLQSGVETLEVQNTALRAQLELYGRDLSDAVRSLGNTFASLERSHRQALTSLARAASFKDGDTGEHIVRIGVLSQHLGLLLGLDKTWCLLLRDAAPMHDIGKIGIPDAILKKPGKLTDEEWTEMRRHPEYGAGILGGSGVALFDLAAEVALSHHEKFDGSGYPHGLAGAAIPVSGRIVALIDFFDALTMKRCYRDAMPDERALAMVRDGSGGHFDPRLVDLFLQRADEFIELREQVNRGETGLDAPRAAGSRAPSA